MYAWVSETAALAHTAGICGNGPNMVLDPPGTQLSHVSSPAKFVEVLDLLCDIKVPPDLLKATEVS